MRKALVISSALLAFVACTRDPALTFTSPPKTPQSSVSSLSSQSFLSLISSSSFSSSASFGSFSSTHALPSSVRIAVPFSPQAPFGNWDVPYQEGCEEMALIMVEKYWSEQSLTREDADEALLDLVAWETEHGYGEDVTIAELKKIAEQYYGHSAKMEYDVTIDAIKEALAQGLPVIVPAAGRMLGNPYFSGEGPWYHMLVITGYDHRGFITNDPGTKRGEGYHYDEATLINAIHDWTGVKENIAQGGKSMLIITGKFSY